MVTVGQSGVRGWVKRLRLGMALARPRRYVFLLSHMRSYSSLLAHIMNSNREISGYVEVHQSYQSQFDLLDLQFKVADMTGGKLRGAYVLDKILHNHRQVSPEILTRDDVYAIFFIRDPEQTIKSMIAMFKGKPQAWMPEGPATYYVRRLEHLAMMATKKPNKSLFFEADLIVEDTSSVLASVDRFLSLKHPLQSEYDLFDLTGRPRFGDPGRFISSGHIVHERRDYSQIELPEEDLLRAKEAFERCREILTERCEIVVGARKES